MQSVATAGSDNNTASFIAIQEAYLNSFSDPLVLWATIGFAAIAISSISLYILKYLQDAWFIRRTSRALKKARSPDEKFGTLAQWAFGIKAEPNEGDEGKDKKGNNRSITIPKTFSGRTSSSLQILMGTFVSLEANRHFVDGLRPAKRFFTLVDPGSPVNIVSYYNTIVRLSLAVTFIGIAFILADSGVKILSILDNADATTREVTEEILPIIQNSGTKFWITANGYSLAIIIMIIHNLIEWRRRRSLSSMSKLIEQSLSSSLAEKYIHKRNDEFSSAEKSELQRVLAKNIEKISRLGDDISDQLIEKMGNIALDSKLTSDEIIKNVKAAFSDLKSQGVTIPVHTALSDEITAMMKTMMTIMQNQEVQIQQLTELAENSSEPRQQGAKTKKK